MRDIAQKANVSQTTVSFVLNKRQSMFISEDTKTRVISAARELGYRPNQMARALAKGRTDTIGIWLKSLHSTYYKQLIQSFDEEITHSHFNMTFARNASILDTFSIMQDFPAMSVDGLIAVDIPETVEYFASHAHSGTPIVSFGCHYSEKVDCVAIDISAAVWDALSYLHNHGRKSIAMIIDEGSNSVGGGPRLEQYLKFSAEAGVEPNVIVIDHQSFASARAATANGFGKDIDAFWCYNDDIALGAWRGLSDRGLSVPDDVAIVGCDDIPEAAYLTPALSTIAQPHVEGCRLAWNFLKMRMEDNSLPIQYKQFDAMFVPRGTS